MISPPSLFATPGGNGLYTPRHNQERMLRIEFDPLTCQNCRGLMRIISIIEDQEVIDKILGYLGLCQENQRPPPQPKSLEIQIDYSDSQLTL
jgi:hypothetical protein